MSNFQQSETRMVRGGRMTKWKGRAASISPTLAQLVATVSAPALMLGATLLPGAASADCVTAPPGPDGVVVTCTGTTTTGVSEYAATGDLTVNVNGDIRDDGGSSAIRASADQGAVEVTVTGATGSETSRGIYTISNQGDNTVSVTTITSRGDGIDAEAEDGNISVTATGLITSGSIGIDADIYDPYWEQRVGDITVNVTDVTARSAAITADTGTGDITINATGALKGEYGTVVRAAVEDKGDISINVNTVEGGSGEDGMSPRSYYYGGAAIYARNKGGKTTVTASGAITTGRSGGVRVAHGDYYGYYGPRRLMAVAPEPTAEPQPAPEPVASNYDIEISVADVTSAGTAVQAYQSKPGSVTITASGKLESTSSDGVRVSMNGEDAKDVTIDVQDVVANSRSGIQVGRYGAGTSNVSVKAGNVTAGRVGVAVEDFVPDYRTLVDGTVDILVTGDITRDDEENTMRQGVSAYTRRSGDVSIEVQGDITNARGGIFAMQGEDAFRRDPSVISGMTFGDLKVKSTGSIEADYGVVALAGASNVTVEVKDVNAEDFAILAGTGNDHHAEVVISGAVNSTNVEDETGPLGSRAATVLVGSRTSTVTITSSGSVSAANGIGVVDYDRPVAEENPELEVRAERAPSYNNRPEYGDMTLVIEGALNGSAYLGNGSDRIELSGPNATIGENVVLDGGDDESVEDGWIDTLAFTNGWKGNPEGLDVRNMEQVSIESGAEVTVTDFDQENDLPVLIRGGYLIALGNSSFDMPDLCSGGVTLGGNSTANAIKGCVSDDSVTVQDSASVAGDIEGAGGADTITIAGGSIGGDVRGGGAGEDNSAAQDTGDTIVVSGGSVAGAVAGDLGDDVFTWSGGTFASLSGGADNDTLTVLASSGFDGSQMLAGDDGSDRLILDGIMVAPDTSKQTGWEALVMTGGTAFTAPASMMLGEGANEGLFIEPGSTLTVDGSFALTGNLTNRALLSMQDGATGDTVTVSGDLAGTGTIALDADLDAKTADMVNVAGSAADAAMTLDVTAKATDGVVDGSAVTLVKVAGAAKGSFTLADGPIIVGAYTYDLELDGSDWQLLGSKGTPVTSAFESVPGVAMAGFGSVGTYSDRVGAGNAGGASGMSSKSPATFGADNTYLVMTHRRGDIAPRTTTAGSSYDSRSFEVMAGLNADPVAVQGGDLVFGGFLRYGTISADVTDDFGTSEIDMRGTGLGLTATYLGASGFYADATLRFDQIKADVSSSAAGELVDDHKMTNRSFSLEMGQRVALSQGVLVPQAQLTLGRIDGGSLTDELGNDIDLGDGDYKTLRVGVDYELDPAMLGARDGSSFWLSADVIRDLSDDQTVTVAATPFTSGNEATWVELGVGGEVALEGGARLFGGAGYRTTTGSGEKSTGLTANLGLKMDF